MKKKTIAGAALSLMLVFPVNGWCNESVVPTDTAAAKTEAVMPVQPEVNQPVYNEPEVNQPVVKQPEVNQPVVNQPVYTEPEVNQPVVNQPVVATPQPAETENAQPAVTDPQPAETENAQPAVTDPQPAETEKTQSVVTDPQSAKSTEVQPSAISDVKQTVTSAVEKIKREIPEVLRVEVAKAQIPSDELAAIEGNQEAVEEALKKLAVEKAVNGLMDPQYEYTSDFKAEINKYNDFVIAINIFEKSGVYAKVDVCGKELNQAIQSKKGKKKPAPAVTAKPQIPAENEVKPVQEVQAVVQPQVVQVQPEQVETLPTPFPTKTDGENTEVRHKWAQGREL